MMLPFFVFFFFVKKKLHHLMPQCDFYQLCFLYTCTDVRLQEIVNKGGNMQGRMGEIYTIQSLSHHCLHHLIQEILSMFCLNSKNQIKLNFW